MFKIDTVHSDLPEMYKKLSKQDEEKAHQKFYEHRKLLNEERIDLCQGNVIKSRYVIEKNSNISKKEETTYEEKVNDYLQQSGLNDPSNIDELMKKTAEAQRILQKNSIQTQVNNLIYDNER